MKNKILLVHWVGKDFNILRNIKKGFKDQKLLVKTIEISHLKHTKIGKRFPLEIKNTSLINLVYLICVFFLINIKSLTYKRIYVLGSNAVYSAVLSRILKKKIVLHYNELPSFIDKKRPNIKSKIDFFYFLLFDHIVVSNSYRRRFFKKLSPQKKYYILDNIYDISAPINTPPINDNNIVKKKPIRLLYTGIFTSNRMVDLLIKTVSDDADYILVLAGYMPDSNTDLVTSINESPNIEYAGFLSYDETQNLIRNHCDYGIAFYSLTNRNNKYCAPLKIHEYFFMKKQLITFKNPPLQAIASNYKILFPIESITLLSLDKTKVLLRKNLINTDEENFKLFTLKQRLLFNMELKRLIEFMKD